MAISRKGFLGSLLGLGLAPGFFDKALPALKEARQASSAKKCSAFRWAH
jgi:hypothetical protein